MGEGQLTKRILADKAKTGLVIDAGYVLIRVKHMSKHLSNRHKRLVLTKVKTVLESISDKFPDNDKRLIEVEIK